MSRPSSPNPLQPVPAVVSAECTSPAGQPEVSSAGVIQSAEGGEVVVVEGDKVPTNELEDEAAGGVAETTSASAGQQEAGGVPEGPILRRRGSSQETTPTQQVETGRHGSVSEGDKPTDGPPTTDQTVTKVPAALAVQDLATAETGAEDNEVQDLMRQFRAMSNPAPERPAADEAPSTVVPARKSTSGPSSFALLPLFPEGTTPRMGPYAVPTGHWKHCCKCVNAKPPKRCVATQPEAACEACRSHADACDANTLFPRYPQTARGRLCAALYAARRLRYVEGGCVGERPQCDIHAGNVQWAEFELLPAGTRALHRATFTEEKRKETERSECRKGTAAADRAEQEDDDFAEISRSDVVRLSKKRPAKTVASPLRKKSRGGRGQGASSSRTRGSTCHAPSPAMSISSSVVTGSPPPPPTAESATKARFETPPFGRWRYKGRGSEYRTEENGRVVLYAGSTKWILPEGETQIAATGTKLTEAARFPAGTRGFDRDGKVTIRCLSKGELAERNAEALRQQSLRAQEEAKSLAARAEQQLADARKQVEAEKAARARARGPGRSRRGGQPTSRAPRDDPDIVGSEEEGLRDSSLVDLEAVETEGNGSEDSQGDSDDASDDDDPGPAPRVTAPLRKGKSRAPGWEHPRSRFELRLVCRARPLLPRLLVVDPRRALPLS